MVRKTAFPAALALLLGSATAAAAQNECKVLCSPVFVAQPGVIITNALNAPKIDAQGNKAESSTDFLFRVTTVIPTEWPRLALVGILQWTPFASQPGGTGLDRFDVIENAPSFVYGPVLSLVKSGPFSLTFDVLGAYGRLEARDDGGDFKQYRHDFLLELDAGLNLGGLMGPDASPFLKSLSLYGFIAQGITNLPKDFGTDDTVYSPTLLFGVTIPVAPLP